jgi:hypothetical protein
MVFPQAGAGGLRYRLYGSLQAMSAPGQWFYDSDDDKLFLWLEDGDSPDGHTIEAKERNLAFDLSNSSHVVVKGLSLFASTITTGTGSTGNIIDSIDARYLSHYNDLVVESPIINNTGYNILTAGELSTGIILKGTGNTLRNSSIAFSAGNGVSVQGTGNVVTGNYIHDVDYQGSYAAGINLTGTGHTIMYNTAFSAGRSALNIDNHTNGPNAQNHRIAYNDFHSVGSMSQDLGVTYFCCNLDMAGTRIDHNWVHDNDAFRRPEAGIFLDCGLWQHTNITGARIDHNVMWNTGNHGVVSNSSRNLTLLNNTSTRPNLAQGICGPSATFTANANNVQTTTVAAGSFVNAAGNDFRPASGSTLIDTGAVSSPSTDGYRGTAPDKGAYEFGGANWVGGCTWGPCWSDKTGVVGATTVNEAEDADLTSVGEDDELLGWTGTGYIDIGTATGSGAEFDITTRAAGAATLRIRYSAPYSATPGVDRTVSLYVNGTKIGQQSVPTTADSSDWAVLAVPTTLVKGANTVELKVDSGDSGDVLVDSLVTTVAPIGASEVIEAENYADEHATALSSAGSGTVVTGIDSGSWLEYANVDFGASGLNGLQLNLAVSAADAGKQFEVRLDGLSGTVIGTVTTSSTGGSSVFATQSFPVTATTGVHDVFLVPIGAGLSDYAAIDWLRFANRATSRIEAESFTAQTATSIANGGTGKYVSNFGGTSMLRYDDIDFGSVGLTSFQASVGSPTSAGQKFSIRLDSPTGTVIGELTVTGTGSWTTFATQSTSIASTTGVHDVYLLPGQSTGYVANVDWITFS